MAQQVSGRSPDNAPAQGTLKARAAQTMAPAKAGAHDPISSLKQQAPQDAKAHEADQSTHEFAPHLHGQGREGRLSRTERILQTLDFGHVNDNVEPGIIPGLAKNKERRANSTDEEQLMPQNQGRGILAQYAPGRDSSLPGFGLVIISKRAIFLDEWAVRLLDLDPHLTQKWVDTHHLLRTLGPEIKNKVFFHLKRLRDTTECQNDALKQKLPCPYNLTAESCFKEPDAANIAAKPENGVSDSHLNSILQHGSIKPPFKSLERPCPKGGYCCRIELQHQLKQKQQETIDFKATGEDSLSGLTSELPKTDSVRPGTAACINCDLFGAIGPQHCIKEGACLLETRLEPHNSRTAFYIILSHGAYAGTKLYVKFNGFFEHGKLSHIMVTFTRVASTLFELVPHMVTDSASFDWIVPTDNCVYGRNYFTMLGYSFKGAELPEKKQKWEQVVIHPDDLTTVHKSQEILASPALGDNYELLYRSKCHNNSYIWTKYIGKVLGRDSHGHATRVLGINIDINRVLEGYEQLQTRVYTDILTGLKNRTYLITHLDEFIYAAHEPLTIIFADVTALKVYNDYLGHTVGDKLLCSVALMFQDNIDRNRELIRISGDEFVCLLPNCNESAAHSIIHKLIVALRVYNSQAPIRMPVFFSLGTKTVDLSAYAGRKLDQVQKDEAQELFYKAMQEADNKMRQHKRMAHEEHYTLVRAYIEQQLKHPISLSDRRLL